MTLLRDLLKTSTGIPVRPVPTSKDAKIASRADAGRLVYITHPGPNGPIHQCQEQPY